MRDIHIQYACDCCSEPSSGKMTRENLGKLRTASSSPVSLLSSPVPPHTMQTRSSTSPTNSHDGTTSMAGKSHWGPQDEAELIQALLRWNNGATSSNAMYSGLKNRCNVWQFWSGCKVVLDRVRMMFSVGGVK